MNQSALMKQPATNTSLPPGNGTLSISGDALDKQINEKRQKVRCSPTWDLERPVLLSDLAGDLHYRFRQLRQIEDLEEVITYQREVLKLSPPCHPNHAVSVRALAFLLSTRLEQKRDLNDLEECIQYYQQALKLTPASHPKQSALLNNFGWALFIRFKQKGDLNDLKESIEYYQQALKLPPASDPDQSLQVQLNNLAFVLFTRFEQKGDTNSLEESIQYYQQALKLTPTSHPDRSMQLNDLACALSRQFRQKGDINDLEKSIEYHQQALELRPVPHSHRYISLTNLASALLIHFHQKRNLDDLEESIVYCQQALELTPAPHQGRCYSLHTFTLALSAQFHQKGDPNDLESIYHQQAGEVLSTPYLYKPYLLSDLAYVLHLLFKQKGDLDYLERSIEHFQQALELTPATRPDRSQLLNNLGCVILTRFEQKGDSNDLEESIECHRQALKLRPVPHSDRALSLNNLASALCTQFELKEDLNDLEESIKFYQEALQLTPAAHSDQPSTLTNLASALFTCFSWKGDLNDLEDSIQYCQQALKLTPALHPYRFCSLSYLGLGLSRRFEQKGELNDLEEAISFLKKGLAVLPPDHTRQAEILFHLGDALILLYGCKKVPDILDNAISVFCHGSASTMSSLSVRLAGTYQWARHATRFSHPSAPEAFRHAINLLPLLASLDLSLHTRQDVLAHWQTRGLTSEAWDFASEACNWAIGSGRLETAVEFFSAARAVFWTQALHLRTPFNDLAALKPSMATRLQEISSALEYASHRGSTCNRLLPDTNARDMDKGVKHCRILVEEWNSYLAQVRELPGFEHFLLPKPFSKLQQAACHGPVIMLSTSGSGCNALLVETQGVRHIPILHLTSNHLTRLHQITRASNGIRAAGQADLGSECDVVRTDLMDDFSEQIRTELIRKAYRISDTFKLMDFHFVLQVLWHKVATPIIDALNLKSSESPPRIWLCPIGKFSLLPIHAAGIYHDEAQTCFSDYATLSYAPTLEALLNQPALQVPKDFSMLAVIEPGSGSNYLPATETELKRIESHVPSEWLTTLGTKDSPSSVEKVLTSLSTASFVHFACHGAQDFKKPLESALLLRDGPLKITQIMQRRMPNASLAFLSACETARGDDKTPDEAMHIAATLLFAGFRGVVGTMWEIDDRDAPHVADIFYKHLFRKGKDSVPDATEAADALRLAVKSLRVDKKVSFERWVPFIHLGI